MITLILILVGIVSISSFFYVNRNNPTVYFLAKKQIELRENMAIEYRIIKKYDPYYINISNGIYYIAEYKYNDEWTFFAARHSCLFGYNPKIFFSEQRAKDWITLIRKEHALKDMKSEIVAVIKE